jgi:hypothetical protein
LKFLNEFCFPVLNVKKREGKGARSGKFLSCSFVGTREEKTENI